MLLEVASLLARYFWLPIKHLFKKPFQFVPNVGATFCAINVSRRVAGNHATLSTLKFSHKINFSVSLRYVKVNIIVYLLDAFFLTFSPQ